MLIASTGTRVALAPPPPPPPPQYLEKVRKIVPKIKFLEVLPQLY